MRNLKLVIEYDGTAYAGWQTQTRSSVPAIQELLEKTLRKILHHRVDIYASGRTDAGVHALAQTANFKTVSSITTEKLKGALNALLPADIAVKRITEVPASFHSRYSAKSKTYRYTICNAPARPAIGREQMYYCYLPLDVKAMQREAACLAGRHDFSAFAASGRKSRDAVRTIKSIRVRKRRERVEIDITADGFLYNMARNIAGTLIDVGRGKLSRGQVKKILDSRDRRKAGPKAPACGLCLMEVKY